MRPFTYPLPFLPHFLQQQLRSQPSFCGPRPLQRMPFRSCHVIVENWKTRENDSCGIALDQLPPPQLGSALNRNRNRLLAVRVARPLHEANARVHAQRFRDRVGIKRESKDSKPDLASGRSVPHTREQLVGVEVEFRKIHSLLKLPVCLGETAPTSGKPLKLPVAHQHRDRLAASGQFHRFAVLRFSDQSRQVAASFRD